jgi:hypothetical protein
VPWIRGVKTLKEKMCTMPRSPEGCYGTGPML